MTDPLAHPGQPDWWDRAADLALELGRARVRLARYEAQETRIRELAERWQVEHHVPGHCVYAEAVRAALDEPEVPP